MPSYPQTSLAERQGKLSGILSKIQRCLLWRVPFFNRPSNFTAHNIENNLIDQTISQPFTIGSVIRGFRISDC